MAKLVFINKNFEEQQYEFMVEKTTVGRGNHNTLVICDNSVSVAHCEILVNGPEVIVRDLDSSNGTFVDGARLNKQAQAKNGNIIKFGLVEARLELPEPRDDDPDASITAVRDLKQFQADQRREDKQKKLHPEIEGKVEPSATVGSADSNGHTVLLPRPAVRKPQPSATPDTEPVVKKPAKAIIAIVVGLAVVALAALACWLWLKK